MKKFVLAITVLALCSLSLAENPSANHQSQAAAAVTRPAAAPKFTALHVFNGGPDGAFPIAPLVQDADGNLYGTTSAGGIGSNGVVFKVSKAGLESVLFNFGEHQSGIDPSAGLILDKVGNLYGTTEGGTPGGGGAVFRLDKHGNAENLFVFQNGQGSEASLPFGGVIMDEAGNLYGTTLFGAPGFGTVYQLDPTGNFTVLYNFQGKSDGKEPRGPLVRDAAGNLYGVAAEDNHENGTIFKLATNGTLTVLHTFTGGVNGGEPQPGLLRDKAGNLFGSTFTGGDSGAGTVYEITKTGKFKRLYSFTGGADGRGPNGELVQDTDGNIYGMAGKGPGTDFLGTVFKLSPTHKLTVLHTFRGGRDGAFPMAGLIRDSAGNLYGTAFHNSLIQRVQGGSVFKIKP
jgi:uncharacterized repeat protein (TIGR03803 family)